MLWAGVPMERSEMLNDTDKQVIVEMVLPQVKPWLVVLFGSQAKGTAFSGSDVDIAYCSDGGLGGYERFCLAQQLAEKLKKDVDLLDLAEASTVMQAQIVTSGEVLYCADESRRQAYYIRTLKEYALLNEEREGVFAQLKRQGVR